MKAFIVGVGLIGGSFALSLKNKGICSEVVGYDISADNAAEAVARGLIDRAVDMDEGVAGSDLIVLAAPVDKIPMMATKILNKVTAGQVVMDMGSTKGELCEVTSMHRNRGRLVATHPMWGTEYKVVDIQPAVDALAAVLLSGKETPLERGNISARCRMIVLYNMAKKRDYLVFGTSNQSEIMMGYFTKFGDGACDVTPLANLYKTEVRQLARIIGVPEDIIAKPPSAGLWEGQTDESEMGIRYEDLDGILFDLERDCSDSQIAVDTGLELSEIARIRAQVRSMEHKRLPAIRPSDFRYRNNYIPGSIPRFNKLL